MAIYGVDIQSIQVKVNRVRVEGLQRTKSDIIIEHVKDVLSASNLLELFTKSQEASEKLEALNIFKKVTIELDAEKKSKKKGKREGEKAERGLQVTFRVKESGWIKSSIGAEAGTQSGGAKVSMMVRNLLGRAEQLQLASSTSFPHWGHTIQLQFIKPYYKDLTKRLALSLGTTDTKMPQSGYQEYSTGGVADLQFLSYMGQHNVTLGYNCRQLYGFTFNVPMTIREEAGHSIKSSIKHSVTLDNRDNPNFPTIGLRSKATNEVAGWAGGDTFYSKMDFLWETFVPLYRDWVLLMTVWSGCLFAPGKTKISDRYLLGGPSTLRGFGMWGAGPRENGFSLGGEAYWASGLHLFTPLPFAPRSSLFRRIRFHAFTTSGSIVQNAPFSLSTLRSLASSSNLRWSCGVGLHFRLGIAQIEFNYAVPLKAHKNDQVQPGFQFGIGLDML